MENLNECVPRVAFYTYWQKKEIFLFYEGVYKEWTFIAVEDGSFQYEIDDVSGIATLGDIVVCPPGKVLKRVVISPLTFHFIRLCWENLEQEAIADEAMSTLLAHGSIYVREKQRLKANYEAMKHSRPYKSKLMHARLNHYLLDIWHIYCNENQPIKKKKIEENAVEDKLIMAVKESIDAHVFEMFNLKGLAESYNMSAPQLSRRFKKAYGVNPLQYMTSMRLEKAKNLLMDTDMNLQQISECCGFQNEYYFNRIFSKHVGLSPGRYRTKHQF